MIGADVPHIARHACADAFAALDELRRGVRADARRRLLPGRPARPARHLLRRADGHAGGVRAHARAPGGARPALARPRQPASTSTSSTTCIALARLIDSGAVDLAAHGGRAARVATAGGCAIRETRATDAARARCTAAGATAAGRSPSLVDQRPQLLDVALEVAAAPRQAGDVEQHADPDDGVGGDEERTDAPSTIVTRPRARARRAGRRRVSCRRAARRRRRSSQRKRRKKASMQTSSVEAHQRIGQAGAALAVDDDGRMDAAPPVDGAVDQVEVDDARTRRGSRPASRPAAARWPDCAAAGRPRRSSTGRR